MDEVFLDYNFMVRGRRALGLHQIHVGAQEDAMHQETGT